MRSLLLGKILQILPLRFACASKAESGKMSGFSLTWNNGMSKPRVVLDGLSKDERHRRKLDQNAASAARKKKATATADRAAAIARGEYFPGLVLSAHGSSAPVLSPLALMPPPMSTTPLTSMLTTVHRSPAAFDQSVALTTSRPTALAVVDQHAALTRSVADGSRGVLDLLTSAFSQLHVGGVDLERDFDCDVIDGA